MLSTIRSSNSMRPSYSAATVRAALEEQPVGELHDVRLVDRGDLAPAVRDRVVEGEPGDPLGRGAGDDLDALGGVRADHVLDARVQVLGVLAHDHEVDVLVARLEALHRAGRAQVGVQAERLAERDVDAPEALADGRRDRALERDLVAPDRLEDVLRERRPVLGHDGLAGVLDLPLERHARGVEDAPGGLRQLGPDAVAGDQGDRVGHGGNSSPGRPPGAGRWLDGAGDAPMRPRSSGAASDDGPVDWLGPDGLPAERDLEAAGAARRSWRGCGSRLAGAVGPGEQEVLAGDVSRRRPSVPSGETTTTGEQTARPLQSWASGQFPGNCREQRSSRLAVPAKHVVHRPDGGAAARRACVRPATRTGQKPAARPRDRGACRGRTRAAGAHPRRRSRRPAGARRGPGTRRVRRRRRRPARRVRGRARGSPDPSGWITNSRRWRPARSAGEGDPLAVGRVGRLPDRRGAGADARRGGCGPTSRRRRRS